MSAISLLTFGAHRGPVTLTLLAMGLLVSASGCGSEEPLTRASASGVVYTDGVELKSGVVRFVPIEGTSGPVVVAPVTDGSFSLTPENGPVVGSHRVEVEATNFLGFDPGDQAAAEQAIRSSGGKLPSSPVPPIYRKRSPLTAEVPPEGAVGLVFLLSSKPDSISNRSQPNVAGLAAAR